MNSLTREPVVHAGGTVERLMLHPSDLLSLEASVSLFLLAGVFKTMPELQDVPIDLTIFFLCTTTCLTAWNLVSRRIDLPPLQQPVVTVILFCELAVASLFWSSLDWMNTDKAARFLLLTSPSFFLGCMIGQDRRRQERMVRLLVWIAGAILARYIWYRYVEGVDLGAISDDLTQRTGLLTVNYSEYSEQAEILFVAFLALVVFGTLIQSVIAVAGESVAFYCLLTIGGRGALIFSVLALPLLALGLLLRTGQSIRLLARLAVPLVIIGGAAGIAYVAFTTGSEQESGQFRTLYRYQLEMTGESSGSVDKRAELRDTAAREWLQKPLLGWGIGEFRVHDNKFVYPHNLFLEILMEMGVVGAALFLGFVIPAVAACLQIARDPDAGWASTTIALLLLTELTSRITVEGYLADDRILFCFLGLAIGSQVATLRSGQLMRAGNAMFARSARQLQHSPP
jgi:O-antigen ligase